MATIPGPSPEPLGSSYGFLLDTYETETLKTIGIWLAFPDDSLDFRPAPKSRSVREQMEHQVNSEARWMSTMLDADTHRRSQIRARLHREASRRCREAPASTPL